MTRVQEGPARRACVRKLINREIRFRTSGTLEFEIKSDNNDMTPRICRGTSNKLRNIYTYAYIYIYAYVKKYICVCVCVCVRACIFFLEFNLRDACYV